MSVVVAYNKRTGTEYVRVEKANAGLLRVFTRRGQGGNLAKPENIELLEDDVVKERAVKVIDKASVPVSVLNTPAQIDLYKLIVGKLETGEKITLDEAKEIWLDKVHRKWMKDKDGHPMRVEYAHHKEWSTWSNDYDWVSANVRMSDDEIIFTVMNWLTRNIGLMVIKGALEVIPMIDLKQLKNPPKPLTKATNKRDVE